MDVRRVPTASRESYQEFIRSNDLSVGVSRASLEVRFPSARHDGAHGRLEEIRQAGSIPPKAIYATGSGELVPFVP